MNTVTNTTSASTEVDSPKRFMEAHDGVTYQEAVHCILAADKELAAAYAARSARITPKGISPRQAPVVVTEAQGIPAGQTLHSRAEALVAEHPHLDYSTAVRQILDSDPALKAAYAEMQS